MLSSEFDCSSNVFRCPRVDASIRYAALRTWIIESRVQVTGANSPVFENEGLVVDMLRRAGLIRSPLCIKGMGLDFSAVARGIGYRITCSLRRSRTKKGLRDLGSELRKIGIAWPARFAEEATTARLGQHRGGQGEGNPRTQHREHGE
jgi:hypothetical protein